MTDFPILLKTTHAPLKHVPMAVRDWTLPRILLRITTYFMRRAQQQIQLRKQHDDFKSGRIDILDVQYV